MTNMIASKTSNDDLLSQTITFLRFPLIVAVVFIHSPFYAEVDDGLMLSTGHDVYDNISYLFSEIFARVAVPLFFLISGFLFFYKTETFTKEIYIRKLKKRVHTLLIPYLFWNFLVAALYFGAEKFFPELLNGSYKSLGDYTWYDWMRAFYGHLFCYPFWFIRDLMVLSLLSPAIYWVVRKGKVYLIVGLGIIWILGFGAHLLVNRLTALSFFLFGSYLSIFRKNSIEKICPFWKISGIFYILSSIAVLFLKEYIIGSYLQSINILIGMFFVVSLTAHFIGKGAWHTDKFLTGSSFFIYAYHGIFILWFKRALYLAWRPQSDAMLLLVYFLTPAIIILAGLGIYYVLKKYLPRTTAFITGGR